MSTVYLVICIENNGSVPQRVVVAVAKTREVAQEALESTRKIHKELDPFWSYDYDIEEWMVRQ